jgi:hypothetical protein
MSARSDHDGEASAAGLVDETLIDAMLALIPEERLRQNDRMLRTIRRLQEGLALATCEPDGQRR